MSNWNDTVQKLKSAARKYWYLMILVILAVILLVWPSSGGEKIDISSSAVQAEQNFSLEKTELKMEEILSKIEGCGKTRVMLTLKASGQSILAEDAEYSEGGDGSLDTSRETVIIQNGSSQESVVVLEEYFPVYRGALVVCEGAANSTVRLRVIEAVCALTGLGTDKITVSAMNKD